MMASSEATPLAATTDVHETLAPIDTPLPPVTPAAAADDEVVATDFKLKVVPEDVVPSVNGPKPEEEQAVPPQPEEEDEEARAKKENGDVTIERENGVEAAVVIDPPKDESVKESPDASIQPEIENDALHASAEIEKKTDEEVVMQPDNEFEDADKRESAPVQVENDVATGAISQLEDEPAPTQTNALPEAKKKPRTSSKSSSSHPSYAQMIIAAIISLQDRTGSSQHAIGKSIEAKYQSALSPNFKKTLANQLKRLSETGQLVKVKNSYKLSGKAKNKLTKRAGGKSEVQSKPKKPKGTASKEKAKVTKKAATSKAKKGRTSKADKTTKGTRNATKASRAKTTKATKTEVAEPTSAKKPVRSNVGKMSSASTKPPKRGPPSPALKKNNTSSKAKPVRSRTTGDRSSKRKAPESNKRSPEKPLEMAAPAKRTRRSLK